MNISTFRKFSNGAALMCCLITTAGAVILPPTDDTSGTVTYNTAKPPVVTKRSLTSLNGTGTTLPVSKTRTAFMRFAVEETGMTAGTVEKARLTLYFPSVTKAGDLSLHVVTEDWEETFTGPTRTQPAVGSAFLTIPAESVVKRQFIIVDVTQQVKDWLTTPGSNYGIAVTSPEGIGNVTMGSKEGSASGYPALLEMEVSVVARVAAAMPPSGMVLIPAGVFTMGNVVAADTDITGAAPVSTTVSAFYMDVNEVTLSQWQSVYYWAKDNGYTDLRAGSGKGPNHPVQTVSWYDVVKWCNARSEQAGRTPVYYTDDAQTTIYKTGNVNVTNTQAKWTANGYRLPTEAEWEKAARGGRSGQRFPWGDTISQNLANYSSIVGGYDQGPNGPNAIGSVGGSSPATSPMGTFASNGYGLNDMAGNVIEWCWDWYGTTYAGGSDPYGPASGSFRVIRGGSWIDSAGSARCADRNGLVPSINGFFVGFRSVLPQGQ